MRVYGDVERVNLSTGERFRRVSGDGESRLVSEHTRLGPGTERIRMIERDAARCIDDFIRKLKQRSDTKMATRFKVACNHKQLSSDGKDVYLLSFNPVYSGSEENKKFFKSTPGGIFQFHTINAEAAAQFEIGKEYYVDIFSADPIPAKSE